MINFETLQQSTK